MILQLLLTAALASAQGTGGNGVVGTAIKTKTTTSIGNNGQTVTGTTFAADKFGLDVNIIGNSGGGSSAVSVTNFPATQPVSGTVGISGTVPVSLSSVSVSNFPATQPVTNAGTFAVQAAQSGSWSVAAAPPANTVISSSITTSGSVILDVSGCSSAIVTLTGSWTGDLQFDASPDGITYKAIAASDLDNLDGELVYATNDTHRFGFSVGSMKTIKVSPVATIIGTANIYISASPALNVISGIQNVVFVDQIGGHDFTVDGSGHAQPVTGTFWQTTQPVSGTFWQTTQPVSLASVPSHAVTNAGTFAVQAAISDGANVTLGAKADAKSTATDTTAITIMQVMKQISASVQAPPSQAVTNAGTFATQAAIADGASVTLGAKADAKSTATDTTAITAMQVLKQISASVQAPPSQAVTNAGTFAVQAATTIADGGSTTFGAKADAKSTATDTTAITAMSVLKEISAMEQAPASRAVTNAGTFAVQAAATVADAADVTLGAKADAKSTATDTTSITVMQVLKQISASVQAPPSQAVTNAGTFAVQAASTLAAETTKVIGTVNISAAQTVGLAAGSQVIGHVIHDTGSTTAVTGTVTTAEATTGGNPCQNPQATLVSITGATSTTNATQIIALSGSTKIYICSLTVVGVSGTTPFFSLVQGTGSNCVTGQTVVVQTFATTANQSYLFSGPVAVGTAGAELCYKDTGTNPVQNYQITYVQL